MATLSPSERASGVGVALPWQGVLCRVGPAFTPELTGWALATMTLKRNQQVGK